MQTDGNLVAYTVDPNHLDIRMGLPQWSANTWSPMGGHKLNAS